MEEEAAVPIMPLFFLPREILIQIFHKLPIKSVLRFKTVYKEWLCLISDPFFRSNYNINDTTYKSPTTLMVISGPPIGESMDDYIDALSSWTPTYSAYEIDGTGLQLVGQPPQPCPIPDCDYMLTLIGSYNGLLALYQDDGRFCLFNPSTKEERLLHVPAFEENFYRCTFLVTGLCHDPARDEYKVVVTVPGFKQFALVTFTDADDNDTNYRFETKPIIASQAVYTTSSSSMPLACALGTTVQGNPHWLYNESAIVYFDWRAQEFKTAQLPKGVETHKNMYHLLTEEKAAPAHGWGALDGQLTVALATTLCKYEVWALKEYENYDSWTRLFVMERWDSPYFSLLSWKKDDWVAFMLGHVSYGPCGNQVVIYDFKNRSFRQLRLNTWRSEYPLSMATYIPTLASPTRHQP